MVLKKNIVNFLLLALVASCATGPSVQKISSLPATQQSQKIYQEAQKLFDLNSDEAAATKLKSLLKQDPQGDLSDDALILLGRIDFRKKNYSSAYSYFEKVFTSTVLSPRENEARILAVQCLLALNKSSDADRLIRNSLQQKLTAKEKAYLLEAQLPLLLAKESQLETFEALSFLSQNHPNANSQERYKNMAKDFIDSKLSSNELRSVSEETDIGDLRVEAMFQYAMKLVEDNQLDSAKNYFSRITSLAPSSYLAQQSSGMIKQLEARAVVESKSIGIVLPMTGSSATIGLQTLKGLQLALGISGSQSRHNLRLHIVDSQDLPDVAATGVENLVLKEHVIAIIGGLTAKTATAEATRAQELGVPFIALSQKPGLTKVGPFIFRSAITPRLQVESLVQVAMQKLNVKSFAVLFPNDRFGVEYSNLFWDEVSRRGGKVVSAQTYPPGETDFKAVIKKMVGTYYTEDRRHEYEEALRAWKKKNKNSRKSPPETLLPPIINFQALFIPDDPKALGQIAPMLAFNDVNDVYLLGTNLWDSPELVARAQNLAEKSIFVDAFLPESPAFLQSTFFKNFKDQFQERPGTFAVLGYDAGQLALNTLLQQPQNRIDFMRTLTSKDTQINGALSPLVMTEDREIIKPLLPLTIKKGQIAPLE